jgi:hypothetical protein
VKVITSSLREVVISRNPVPAILKITYIVRIIKILNSERNSENKGMLQRHIQFAVREHKEAQQITSIRQRHVVI